VVGGGCSYIATRDGSPTSWPGYDCLMLYHVYSPSESASLGNAGLSLVTNDGLPYWKVNAGLYIYGSEGPYGAVQYRKYYGLTPAGRYDYFNGQDSHCLSSWPVSVTVG